MTPTELSSESTRHELADDVAHAVDLHPDASAESKRGPRVEGRALRNYMLVVGCVGNGWMFVQSGKVIYTESAKDISLTSLMIVVWALGSWLFYGIWIRSPVLIAANIVGFSGSLLLLAATLMYR